MMRNIILLPFTFFSLGTFAQSPSAGKLYMDAAIIKLQNAKAYTLGVAEAMPEEKFGYKPTDVEMSFGDQVMHLSYFLDWQTSVFILNQPNPFKDTARMEGKVVKAEAIKTLTWAYDYALRTLQQFDPAHLGDTVQFLFGPLTKMQIMNLMNDHATHHRAQMIVYLRLNGIKPPDYDGW